MTYDYAVEQTREGIPLLRKNVEGINVRGVEGLCVADINNPNQPRNREWYVKNVHNNLIASGKISDGTNSHFDDRKFRLDYTSLVDGTLKLGLGASHYLAFREDFERGPEGNENLKQKGIKDFNDQWAYFSRAPGVRGLIITTQGSIVVGERSENVDLPGALNGVTGHLTYKDNPIDVNLEAEVLKESREELGIDKSSVKRIILVGGYMSANRGDMDFSHLVFTDVPNKYFEGGAWMEKVSKREREHKELVLISQYGDIQTLLNTSRLPGTGKRVDLMYSTRGALQSIRPDEMAT